MAKMLYPSVGESSVQVKLLGAGEHCSLYEGENTTIRQPVLVLNFTDAGVFSMPFYVRCPAVVPWGFNVTITQLSGNNVYYPFTSSSIAVLERPCEGWLRCSPKWVQGAVVTVAVLG